MRSEQPGSVPAFILITGASSGIGAALDRAFAKRGEALALELRQAHGVDVEIVPCDLTQPGAAASLHAEVRRRGLVLKGLVNNAGFGLRGRFRYA